MGTWALPASREEAWGRQSLKAPWVPSDALWPPTLYRSPPVLLTEAEKQEQEAAAGGGAPGPPGRLGGSHGHSLWRRASLISLPLGRGAHPTPCPPLALGQCRAL